LKKGALIWSDEFDSIAVLNQNWIQEEGGHGWGNNELQYYTIDNKNTIINNGNLTIQARLESFGGRRFTSSRLISRNKFKYGVYEMRATLPVGRGTWPAFWLLGAKRPLNWPDDGEIDIMEHVG
jgi:beta-glucanase (GH16 family)